MIIKKEVIKIKKDGTPVYNKKLNVDFWKDINEKEGSINVILDEAHTLINSRRAMSGTNKVMSDFLALLRRVLGNSPSGYGTLTLISQLERRLDIIACEMATNIRFHICHYKKICKNCGSIYNENNESPDPLFQCPNCFKWNLEKCQHKVEIYEFKNMDLYRKWFFSGAKTYFKRYMINDIEQYFKFYNTLQWDNLISEDD